MATRYCGNVKIVVKFDDASNTYKCSLSWLANRLVAPRDAGLREYKPVKQRLNLEVGTPKLLTEAVDCPEAYDKAAHAALSFATDEEDGPGGNELCYRPDGRGTYWIARKADLAWGEPSKERAS